MNKKQNIAKVIQFTLCVLLLCALFYNIYKTAKQKQLDRPVEIHTQQTTNVPEGATSYIVRDANGEPIGIIIKNAKEQVDD